MEFFTLESLVWTLFAAILAAILYSYCMQRILSEFAKRIMKSGANSETTAKTLAELGYTGGLKTFFTYFFAENGNYISKAVKKVKSECAKKDSELLFEEKAEVKYYIPDENNNARLKKHINDGISLPLLVCLIVVLVVIALVSTTVIGWLQKYTVSSLSDDDIAYGVEKEADSLLGEQAKANKEDELEKKKLEELERIEQQAKEELEEALKSQNSAEESNG